FTVSGGIISYIYGSIWRAGTLLLINTTANFTPDFTFFLSVMRLHPRTTLFPYTTLFRSLGTLNATNSTINAALINQGLLVPLGNDTFAQVCKNQSGDTVCLLAIAGVVGVDLTVSSGFANNGLIELSSINGVISPALHVSAGTLVNAVGEIGRASCRERVGRSGVVLSVNEENINI